MLESCIPIVYSALCTLDNSKYGPCQKTPNTQSNSMNFVRYSIHPLVSIQVNPRHKQMNFGTGTHSHTHAHILIHTCTHTLLHVLTHASLKYSRVRAVWSLSSNGSLAPTFGKIYGRSSIACFHPFYPPDAASSPRIAPQVQVDAL